MMNSIEISTTTTARLRSLVASFIDEALSSDTDDMFRLIQREELSMPRIVALKLVAKRSSVSITEISHVLDLSLGNTSMMVDKLVSKELVTRTEDATDRRHKCVMLTDKGRMLVEELRELRVQSVVQRMLTLPPDLLDRMIDVLGDVVEQLPPQEAPKKHRAA